MFENALDDSATVRVSGEGEDLRDTHNCTSLLIQHVRRERLELTEQNKTPVYLHTDTKGAESPLDYS